MRLVKAARGGITTRHGEDIGRDAQTGAKGHVGIDIGHGNQTADDLRIGAPAEGRVRAVGNQGTYGLRIIIDHPDGTWSLIAHLAEEFVEVGQQVSQNQRIGTMGSSGGNWAVHCHQEYHLANGTAVDPLAYMTTAAGGNTEEIDVTFNDDDRLALFQVRQLLTETKQWMGIGPMLAEVYKIVGVIRQLISETTGWEGIDARLSRVAVTLDALVARGAGLSDADRAAIAREAAAAVQPIDIGELVQLIDEADDDEHKQLATKDDIAAMQATMLAALDQLDEAALASFGLQRIERTSA